MFICSSHSKTFANIPRESFRFNIFLGFLSNLLSFSSSSLNTGETRLVKGVESWARDPECLDAAAAAAAAAWLAGRPG